MGRFAVSLTKADRAKISTWCLLLVPTAAMSLIPVGVLFVSALNATSSDQLFSTIERDVIVKTLILSLGTSSVATLLGMVVGAALGALRFRGKSLFRIATIAPLLVPPYIHAIGWTHLVRHDGWASRTAAQLFPTWDQSLSDLFHSLPGGIAVLSLALFPIAAYFTDKALYLVPASLIEATRVNGGSAWHIWKAVLWPAVRPAAASSAMIIFLLAGAELGVPTVLRIDVFNFEVFTALSAFNDTSTAVLLSIPMVVVGVVVVLAELPLGAGERRASNPDVSFGAATRNATFRQLLAPVAVVLVAQIPFVTLILSGLDTEAYIRMSRLATGPAGNTLLYVVSAGAIAMVLSLGLSIVLYGTPHGLRRLTDLLLVIGFAIPGTILGLALLGVYERSAFSRISAPILVVGALMARYQVVAYRGVSQSVFQIPKEWLESARIEGASGLQSLRYIILPIIGSPALRVLLIFMVLGFNEMGTTILLYPPGGETLPIALYSIEANSPRAYVASLAVISVVVEVIAIGAVMSLVQLSSFEGAANRNVTTSARKSTM